MTKLNGRGMAALFTANSDLEVVADASATLHGHGD
jgi:hypothetical protein